MASISIGLYLTIVSILGRDCARSPVVAQMPYFDSYSSIRALRASHLDVCLLYLVKDMPVESQ